MKSLLLNKRLVTNSVDEVVRSAILTFPSQFPNRSAVLHHALCVIGNGYEWSNKGTLVNKTRHLMSEWDMEEKLAEIEVEKNFKYASRIVKQFALADLRREFKVCAKVVSEIDTRVHKRGRIKGFYPQSHYALLMNIPSNVTPEWEEACEDMKALAQKAGWVF